MIDIKDFFRLIVKYKYVLLGIPLIAIVITFFLVRNLPDLYDSRARIGTGIVDDSQQTLDKSKKQESEINQQFNNLTQMILLKRMIDQVSYSLMLHDLTSKEPFRKETPLMKDLNQSARKHAIETYSRHLREQTELSLYNADQNGLNTLLKSYGYDELSLRNKLSVYRVNNSDYIDIQFESENPQLSAFVANTLTRQFIDYYGNLKKENQDKTSDFLARLLREKYAAWKENIQALKKYKIEHHVLNLGEQAKSLFGQISDFETRRQTAQKEIISYSEALKNVNNKFSGRDRKYLEATVTDANTGIVQDKELLHDLSKEYMNSNFDVNIKTRIDSVRKEMVSKINRSTDEVIFNPMAAKQDLVTEKLGMEKSLDIAKNSVSSLQREIDRLNNRFDGLVPHEAVIQEYENNIDIAAREYLDILNRYNETNLNSNFSVKLRQIDLAMPEAALPSKKMLLVVLSGIISVAFCMVVLFVFFYLDNSVVRPSQLAQLSKTSVLGSLPLLTSKSIDLNQLWESASTKEDVKKFKNMLRSIRFEIDTEMAGSKLLVITSTTPGEGKTFVAVSLAYAAAMSNKKVLLIDGNFNYNTISRSVNPELYLEDYLQAKCGTFKSAFQTTEKIFIMGNKGNDISLQEITTHSQIECRLNLLKDEFDIIIVEASSLASMNKAKEWMTYADNCIGVFEANKKMTASKKQSIRYLSGMENGAFAGWIMNKTTLT